MKKFLNSFVYLPSINFEKKEYPHLIYPLRKELYIQVGRDGELMLEILKREGKEGFEERIQIPESQFHLKVQDLIDALKIFGILDLKFKL